ncbi:PHB depolymerase family esterase [Dactylosporangium sp. AC04546]|uniref:extracellular catalytic domain type 1 short-chain-length polyhydroxyalkanoate depolymerase n=1 Tax=Dactylosporangium sp. AC04546 TaxID=2862460 RepID=UPI001EDEB446|nr:PHB depolymerase family esterase [Dactylosporangium sp. AC04546]WVK87408.1 PHB depolymerase family esterase [Dactylosporangium sp. AC04546]
MNRNRLLTGLAALVLAATGIVLLASPAQAATLTEVTNFGTNPSSLRMHLYVPNTVTARPAVVVAVHYCTGSGPAFYSGTEFASLADRYGFIVVYPSATRSGSCFDVSSPQALRRGGGSDPVGIMSMVNYVLQNNNADPNRVYVTGASSGGMMTNVLLGDYPDVFKAGAAFMGVPFGCFATTDGSSWNSQCSSGQRNMTPQQWGDLVRAAYPGYTGARPRMQVWHGTTDTTLAYPNFNEEIEQWTNVLGVSQTPVSTDTPQANWTRTRYGNASAQAPVEAISIAGVGHSLPMAGQAAMAIEFFGLTGSGPTSPPPSSSSPSPSASASPSNPNPGTGGCTATVAINQWQGGFVATVRVTAGSSGTNSWSVRLTLPSGATISNAWNTNRTANTGAVTFTNVTYNGKINAGQFTEFGFQSSGTAGTLTPTCTAT